jgi:hypothetical protein
MFHCAVIIDDRLAHCRAYESTLSMLRKWVENGQLGGNVAARCETILAQIRDEKLMKFNEVVAAAVLFIACRQVCAFPQKLKAFFFARGAHLLQPRVVSCMGGVFGAYVLITCGADVGIVVLWLRGI